MAARPARHTRRLAAGIAALAMATGTASAQTIEGRALDADGQPIPQATVALHRVDETGGAFVDAGVTDAEGRFAFRIEGGESAVHFVALRHADRLYIGAPIRGGADDVAGYVVRAEPSAEAGALASALSGTAPGMAAPPARGGQGPGAGGAAGPFAGTGAFWLVGLLALATAAIILTQAPVYRSRRRRELLIELATLENRLAAAEPGDADLQARRTALLRRLEPAG